MKYSPGWKKGIYPTDEYLLDSIKNGELYIGEIEGNIAACMVVNHKYNEGYKGIKWSVEAADPELLVIHILGVLPAYSGRGTAKQMVRRVIETARENNIKTIRLDVLIGNIPAEKLYTKMGFNYLETVRMYYEDTGWTEFKLFEYII
ncbi:MAG: GNAT family N-acetyltransferase [Oscillospiraceae bacterium]|nr:GNAT family N-acetyltransferase [Oscillospiraceae bacterium]